MQVQRRDDQERKSGFEVEVIDANFDVESAEVDSEVEDARLAEIVSSAEVEVEVDAVSECLHTISGTQTERDESFDDEGGEKLIKSDVEVVILTA